MTEEEHFKAWFVGQDTRSPQNLAWNAWKFRAKWAEQDAELAHEHWHDDQDRIAKLTEGLHLCMEAIYGGDADKAIIFAKELLDTDYRTENPK